ncbi:MAG: hypothetical protein UV94_C0003G0026 [Parcubacteria group bacterium GW2011_GWC1_43_30]|nr:MAG: hypothetical protein UV94_C0003G0026 [Parcubacteria group bacterium GW2011_GWC1_43_30]
MLNNNKRKRIITIFVVLGILAGLVALWPTLRKSSSDEHDEQEPFLLSDSETLSDWEGYAHPELPFAFAYPKDLTLSTFADGEAEIVLLKGKEPEKEVQIVIRAFDESGPLTVERIQRDVPEMVIDEPQNVLIGSAQVPALLFWSEGGSAGRTREVWFIYPERSRGVQGAYLYQVTASAEMDETLAKMMETWRFE